MSAAVESFRKMPHAEFLREVADHDLNDLGSLEFNEMAYRWRTDRAGFVAACRQAQRDDILDFFE